MKVLVIPDIHLQPWIFQAADYIMERYNYDRIVILGDIVDSHGDSGKDLTLYYNTLETALKFAKKYSSKLTWLLGNHEVGYASWKCVCSEHNYEAEPMVKDYFREICKVLGKSTLIAARIDNLIFSHAGFTEIRATFYGSYARDTSLGVLDRMIDGVNQVRYETLWEPQSPIWYRPSSMVVPYDTAPYLQVVGHTPVKTPYVFHNMLLTDTFWAEGMNVFPVIDSVDKEVMWLTADGDALGAILPKNS